MITQVALIWSGGAVATAFAVTGSSVVGVPMHLGKALFLALLWPAALPWMCWVLARQKRVAELIKRQAHVLSGRGGAVYDVQWDVTEKRILEQLGIHVPADIDEQAVRETEALSRFFVEHRSVTQTHPFATARALLSLAQVFIFAECEYRLRDVPQPVPEGYARKVASAILLTHAHRCARTE